MDTLINNLSRPGHSSRSNSFITEVLSCNGKKYRVNGYYELLIANFLNKHNIRWHINSHTYETIHEEKTIRYMPDFVLDDMNIIIEVKGKGLDGPAKRKVRVFKQYFSNMNKRLLVIKVGKLINNPDKDKIYSWFKSQGVIQNVN